MGMGVPTLLKLERQYSEVLLLIKSTKVKYWPLDESEGSPPLRGHGSWLTCEVAIRALLPSDRGHFWGTAS